MGPDAQAGAASRLVRGGLDFRRTQGLYFLLPARVVLEVKSKMAEHMDLSSDKSIVVAAGSDLAREGKWGQNTIDLQGINDSRKLLSAAGYKCDGFLVTPNYFRKNLRFPTDRHDILFNSITDADLNPKVLDVLERFLVGTPFRVINHPARIRSTTRDLVAAKLSDVRGLIVPTTLRLARRDRKRLTGILADASFRFPAILRPTGTHTGIGAQVVRNLDGVQTQLDQTKECYLTELANYRSRDGYFRKYRCVFIGESILFRHLIISDGWSIHARDRNRLMLNHDWMQQEENEIHARGIEHFSPQQLDTLGQIRELLQLDYFGVDFAMAASGDLLLFEANATMNLFPSSPADRSHFASRFLPRAVEALRDLIERPGS